MCIKERCSTCWDEGSVLAINNFSNLPVGSYAGDRIGGISTYVASVPGLKWARFDAWTEFHM